MDFLRQLSPDDYPNGIGPGVYFIHTPRLPSVAEFERLIHEALQVFRPEQLWVNPECGLKTRRWEEVQAALKNVVLATRRVRSQLKDQETPALTPAKAIGNRPYTDCAYT